MVVTLLLRLLVTISLLLLIDLYAFQAFRTIARTMGSTGSLLVKGGFLLTTGLMYAAVLYILVASLVTGTPNYKAFQNVFAVLVLLYVPKLVVVLFLFGEDLYRGAVAAYQFLMPGSGATGAGEAVADESSSLSRREFVSYAGLAVASVPFLGILHGITYGRYKYTTHVHEIRLANLPAEFDGFTLAQISDIHSGSFTNRDEVRRGVELVNQVGADAILFTGDLVNNRSEELEEWADIFSLLRAPEGVYSVLGNHDYGDYVKWPSEAEKERNLQRLKDIQKDMGWQLLLNEHRRFRRGDAEIALVGVENWGLPPFPQKGDLDKATAGLPPELVKVLMSHDPSHWDAQILAHPSDIDLSLAGHTHGMQFGIEIPGVKWSPVKFKYPRWAGLYEENGKFLNVNRGFGTIGFPGRVGIFPEITKIVLRKA